MRPTLKDVRRELESCEIAHGRYAELLAALERRIEDRLDGGAPAIECVIGPSRAGKSMLLNALRRRFPETSVEGCRRVEVLPFTLPTSVSPKHLPNAVLEALGVSSSIRSAGVAGITKRMKSQLQLAGTKVLLADEASHTVDEGTRVSYRAAADWFKETFDMNMTIVLFGLGRLRKLLDSNEQLRLRAQRPYEFRPYDCRVEAEMRQFAACVSTFASRFAKAGWPIAVPQSGLIAHCYLLSGGLVGVLSRFFQQLAYLSEGGEPRELAFADCARAALSMEASGSPLYPAFVAENGVSTPMLKAAHAAVIESSGLAVLQGGSL